MGAFLRERERLWRLLLGPSVELELSIEADAVVLADVVRLEQLVSNLVVNARDAMPSGGRFAVTLATGSVEGSEPSVVLDLADTGSGMPPHVLARAFEPFFSTKAEGRGSGLGLMTVREVAIEHGGSVEVTSDLGVGTRFRVRLPVARGGTPAAPQRVRDVSLDGGGRVVLVVEDNDGLRAALEIALRRSDYRVVSSRTAEEALAREPERTEELLLVTDVTLPEMDGLELVRRLRARRPRLPVIVMSGHPLTGLPPAVDVLLKPFSTSELLERLAALAGPAAVD